MAERGSEEQHSVRARAVARKNIKANAPGGYYSILLDLRARAWARGLGW